MCFKSAAAFFQKSIAARKTAGFFSFLLLPVTVVYFFGYCLTRICYVLGVYQSRVLPGKVISVGNLTVGGTGKTPFSLLLAEKLAARKKETIILLRGYGEDEIHLLKSRAPEVAVLPGKNRYRNAIQYAAKTKSPVFILDDGFQHWKLQRSINLLLINGVNPFGNGWLVPSGILREPLRAIRRADYVVITHADRLEASEKKKIEDKIKSIKPSMAILYAQYRIDRFFQSASNETKGAGALKGKQVIGLCAIGFPEGFRMSLEQEGANIVAFLSFPDHATFEEKEITQILNVQEKSPQAVLVITEKDYNRSPELFKTRLPAWVFCIKTQLVVGDETLNAIIDAL